MARPGARLGRVTRVTTAGPYVELDDVAPGFEFGPCIDTVGDLAPGDRVITQPLAADEDEHVITGVLGGRPPADLEPYATDADLAAHTHPPLSYVQSIGTQGQTFEVPNDSTFRRPTHVAAVTFTSPGPDAVYRLTYNLDAQTSGAGAYFIANHVLDGITFRPQGVLLGVSGAVRAPVSKELRAYNLPAGDHTYEVRVSTLGNGTATVLEHGTCHVQRIS